MTLSSKLAQRGGWEPPALPALNILSAAVQRIHNRWPDVVPEPPEKDREAIVQKMKARLAADHWDGALMSFVLMAARALFDEQRRQRSDLAQLRNFYADEVRASRSATFLNGMAAIYLGSYAPGSSHTRSLATSLRSNMDRLGANWRDLFRRIPDCLDPDYAPDGLAKLMINMSDPWTELKQVGIRLPHAPGLMDHVHLAYVKLLQPQLKEQPGLDRLFGWLRPPGQQPRNGGAAEAISAILSHWTTRDPKPEVVSHITQTLVSAYQDPRISRGGVWSGVPAASLAVIMRWLTGENIRFFLDTVTAVEESHMWEPRRKFWLKLYEQGRINAAWVAFSEEAERYARRSLAGAGAGRALSYGNQVAGGNRRNTSLLVLEVGNKVVVEGSHNYMVHIFKKDTSKSPQLYQRSYDCEFIRRIPDIPRGFHESRIHDAHGSWRGWVLERV